ncbi:hypothetical protein D3Z60_13730 [Lachnospiraceae bacterium]|nr:hypothetical protein [Lachnospiraceae bacterium]
MKKVVKEVNDFEKNSADRKEKPELEDIFNKYTNDYGNNYDKDKAQKNIEIERYAFRKLHEKGLENTNIERLLDITISESKTLYDIKQSIETRVGLVLALWGVLVSALVQSNIPLSNIHIMFDSKTHMAYRIIVVIILIGLVLFGLSTLGLSYITLKSNGHYRMSLWNKEMNFKRAADDKYISMVQLWISIRIVA